MDDLAFLIFFEFLNFDFYFHKTKIKIQKFKENQKSEIIHIPSR